MSRSALRSIYFLVAAAVIVLDRLTKHIVARSIELNFGSVQVIPNFFSITHVENTGAAFSLFADWPQRVRVPMLVSFSVLAMFVVAYLIWSSAKKLSWAGFALALILGGAVGNLYDRILYGRVTDFLHVYVGAHTWPDFNLADSAIVTGAILLGIDLLFGRSPQNS